MEDYRVKKLNKLKELKVNPYVSSFRIEAPILGIVERYKNLTDEDLLKRKYKFTIAGRIISLRNFGKATFITLRDRTGTIQAYIREKDLTPLEFAIFENTDIGDFAGISGYLFKTKTGELTLFTETYTILTKVLSDLPEKWHGLKDVEKRLRQRYLDILVNNEVKELFTKRSKIIQNLRNYFLQCDFLEVETPMMQTLAGGATAEPFETYHNTLDMKLYLRIAPELYLKRLVIGGFERVFEINRNFRNEGISTRHNPEFTMVEWYMAYADYFDLMNMTEKLINYIVKNVCGITKIEYNNYSIDLTPPWPRISLIDAIKQYTDIDMNKLENIETARKIAMDYNLDLEENITLVKIIVKLFEKTVEEKLINPTFIIDYPKEVSPLAKSKETNPEISERFELYIGGMEIANGFNELNDPAEQKLRFEEQIDKKLISDNKEMDSDYIKALEYGLPPTAGEGMGIDRLVMLLTNSSSIRDVILFPHLKKED
jgi:lysyl-tRNA synthetase class 2